ncbi:MAG: tetratricopeptide repeat protein [Cyclobacteriaceae bacterium]
MIWTGMLMAQCPLFDSPANLDLVGQGAHMIYSMDKDSAEYYIKQARQRLPNHPVGSAMEAFLILWQNIPVLEDSVFEAFKSKLNQTIEEAQALGKDHPEGIFFEMTARGLLAEYWADRGYYMKAFGEANQTYSLLKESFDLTAKYPEFLFIVGLYNYFREAYPERHPVYKPLLWFFHEGDIELGLDQITQATSRTVLSKVESHVYLTYIYLRYEQKPIFSKKYINALLKTYPNNPYVRAKYLESISATKTYEVLDPSLTLNLMEHDKSYYKMTGYIYEGLRLEMNELDMEQSLIHYKRGLNVGDEIPNHGDYYKSVGYLGAGRVLQKLNRHNEAEYWLRKALEIAETDELEEEAELLLAR